MEVFVLYPSISVTWFSDSLGIVTAQCFFGLDMCLRFYTASLWSGVSGEGLAPPTGFLLLSPYSMLNFRLCYTMWIIRGIRWLNWQHCWWLVFLDVTCFGSPGPIGSQAERWENKHGGRSTGEKFILFLILPASAYSVKLSIYSLQLQLFSVQLVLDNE